MNVYVSGILLKDYDLPLSVKIALNEYVREGHRIVITARTDSDIRDVLRKYINSFPYPKLDLIHIFQEYPGRGECISDSEIDKYGIDRAFFMWDKKDPLTIFELLCLKHTRSEVYLYDSDEIRTVNNDLVRFIIPPRKVGTVPYDQKFHLPEEIFKQLEYPERTKAFIASHEFLRSDMMALIKYSGNALSDKLYMFNQLQKTEDLLNDLTEYHYCYCREGGYTPDAVFSKSVYYYLSINNPDMDDLHRSLFRKACFRSLSALAGLHENGSILTIRDGGPGSMVVLDGAVNLYLIRYRRVLDNKETVLYGIAIGSEFDILQSRQAEKALVDLHNLLILADPDFDGVRLSNKAIDRIISAYTTTGSYMTLDEFKIALAYTDNTIDPVDYYEWREEI